MALLDELTRKAVRFSEDVVDKTQDFASKAQLQLKIKSLEADCHDLYYELGKYYYHKIQQENSIDAATFDMRQRINEVESEIADLKKVLDEGE